LSLTLFPILAALRQQTTQRPQRGSNALAMSTATDILPCGGVICQSAALHRRCIFGALDGSNLLLLTLIYRA
jgi:hypothetical protein